MDPKACLDAAESAVRAAEATEDNLLHIEECEEHLANYREWRRKDGFEPEGGDARCRSITIRLEALPTESGRPFSYSGPASEPTTDPEADGVIKPADRRPEWYAVFALHYAATPMGPPSGRGGYVIFWLRTSAPRESGSCATSTTRRKPPTTRPEGCPYDHALPHHPLRQR